MTEAADARNCRNCDKEFAPEDLDADEWCAACRREVVRRSTLVARVAGGVGAIVAAAVIFILIVPSERFLVFWVVLIALVGFVTYKFARRIAFEVIRDRGVPPVEG